LHRIVVGVGQGLRLGSKLLSSSQHRLRADDVDQVLLGLDIVVSEGLQDGVGVRACRLDPCEGLGLLTVFQVAFGTCLGDAAFDQRSLDLTGLLGAFPHLVGDQPGNQMGVGVDLRAVLLGGEFFDVGDAGGCIGLVASYDGGEVGYVGNDFEFGHLGHLILFLCFDPARSSSVVLNDPAIGWSSGAQHQRPTRSTQRATVLGRFVTGSLSHLTCLRLGFPTDGFDHHCCPASALDWRGSERLFPASPRQWLLIRAAGSLCLSTASVAGLNNQI